MRYTVYIASNIWAENDRACYTEFHSHRVGIKVQAKMCTYTLGLQDLFLPTLMAALLLTFGYGV